jgi:hypothetical protein
MKKKNGGSGDDEKRWRKAVAVNGGTLLKKVRGFPVPSGDVTYQTLPGRE